MIPFHRYLDKYFKQKLSFSIFVRLWLAIAVVISIIGVTSYYALQKTIRPSAKRIVEDTLVDTSRLLARMLEENVAEFLVQRAHDADVQFTSLNHLKFTQPNLAWYDQKTDSQFHLYITDSDGIVIYDSTHQDVGKNYSQWNDIYLTLQGKYGARSTQVNGSSVMYVASPILHDGQLIGVVSVGKPTIALAPYLQASEQQLIKILLQSTVISLIIALFVAAWLRHSIASINHYTKKLGNAAAPHFYLAYELNELTQNIKQMKETIENKAYVTDYVHSLTHELKSPLSAIKASGELLCEDEMASEDRQNFGRIIVSQSDRLHLLVDKLLVLAKIEQPNFHLHKQTLAFDVLIERITQQLYAKFHQNALHYHSIFLEKYHWQADEFWVSQALQNTLDNALQHALSFVLCIGGQRRIYIINDSVALPDYVFARAFERYFSANFHPHHAKDTKGTGLGLPLVAQIMHLHNGEATLHQSTWSQFISTIPKNTQATLVQQLNKQPKLLQVVERSEHLVILTLNFDTQSL